MALNIFTFGVRGVDADALWNGNQQLNGADGPNELTAGNLIWSNGLTFQQLLLFAGEANDGDLNIDAGETAFNLSDMAAQGSVVSLGITNGDDPIRIRAHGLVSSSTLGDLTAGVRFDNTVGFGLDNAPDGNSAAPWLNRGDSLTFELTAIGGVSQFLATASFVVNVNGGGSESVIIDFDGDVVTQTAPGQTAVDGINLGIIASGTTVTLDFAARTIQIGVTTRAMTNSEYLAFLGGGLNQLTIGSHNTSTQGFAIGNLTITSTDSAVSGEIIHAPTAGGVTTGTANNDVMIGGTAADILNAGAGDDVVFGGGGADTLNGGDGNDIIEGGDGDDVINGGAGNDIIIGGVGNDTVAGGAGSDTFVFRSLDELTANTDHITDFEPGVDTVDLLAIQTTSGGLSFIGQNLFNGVAGEMRFEVSGGMTEIQIDADGDGVLDDRVFIDNGQFNLTETAPGSLVLEALPIVGTGGGDALNGTNQFDDQLFGLAGADNLSGGDRNDTLDGGDGDDVIDGGAGIDTASYSAALAGVFVDLNLQGSAQDTLAAGFDTLISIENVIGTDFDDVIFGNGSDNTLSGGGGDDFIRGGGGNDSLFGGTGEDSLVGFSGSDTLFGGDGNDFLLGNTGAVLQSTVSEFIYGGSGNDFMRGGIGDDVLDGGDGTDRVSYFGIGDVGATVGVTIDLSLRGISQNTGGAGWDTITSIEDVSGSEFGDTLTGSDADEFLHGGGGNDTISAGAGNDVLYGGVFNGLGTDFLDGGDGIDTVDFNLRDPRTEGVIVNLGTHTGGTVSGGEVDTLNNIENVIGTNFDDQIIGDEFENELSGLGGDDTLNGGLGDDTLSGGAGGDTFIFDTAIGAGNVDAISDFSAADDVIHLDTSIFGIAAGVLDAGAFHVGAAATDAAHRIIYDDSTGALYLDADGDGAGAAILFATLAPGLALTNEDLFGFGP